MAIASTDTISHDFSAMTHVGPAAEAVNFGKGRTTVNKIDRSVQHGFTADDTALVINTMIDGLARPEFAERRMVDRSDRDAQLVTGTANRQFAGQVASQVTQTPVLLAGMALVGLFIFMGRR